MSRVRCSSRVPPFPEALCQATPCHCWWHSISTVGRAMGLVQEHVPREKQSLCHETGRCRSSLPVEKMRARQRHDRVPWICSQIARQERTDEMALEEQLSNQGYACCVRSGTISSTQIMAALSF